VREQIERQLLRMESSWIVVEDYKEVVQTARMIARRHALRSGDAIQRAAALSFDGNAPDILPFVTLDHELAVAARAEGFSVLS
jgi:predicted nucleic acid-binding protein